MSNTTRRSFLSATVAILASAVSGFRGKTPEPGDSKAPLSLDYEPRWPGAELSQRFPETMQWLADHGWDIEWVPEWSVCIARGVIEREAGYGIGAWEGGYEARAVVPGYEEVAFSFSLISRDGGKTADRLLLNQVKYSARKALEEAGLDEVYVRRFIRYPEA